MTLTQDFKNECDRIINTWHPLIQYYDKGSSYKDLADFILKKADTVLSDPFFLSFKTTRTFEEIKWMSKRIQEYYSDNNPQPTGIYYYILALINSPKEQKEDIQKLMHYYHWLRVKFFRYTNEGGFDNVSKELDTLNQRPNITADNYQKLQDNQEKHTADQLEKHKPEDLKPTDYEQIKQDLATAQQATEKAQEAQAKAEQATKDKEQELKTSKEQQIAQGSELKNNLFKVSRKLMMLYNEQIKKQTELFYQDLSLDNNWINEKYGNKNKPYLYYLARTSTETDPEQAISAFRIVALIVATEKAQETTDKYKDGIGKLQANLKKNNLKKFKNIKETWESIADEEPQEANNPLYLPIIKNKNEYIAQIDKIISIWQ